MNQRKKGIAPLAIVLIVLLAGCSSTQEATNGQKKDGIKVVTTFYPVYEFSKEVVGEAGQVEMILEAGQDMHSFEPSPKDIATIAEADVFVHATPYMETWVPDMLTSLEDSDVQIVEAAEGIDLLKEGKLNTVDPHVWLDPVYAQSMVATISAAMQEADLEHANTYLENTEKYIQELVQLDQEYQQALGAAVNRTFVVQHAAFDYLARRYNLQGVAISSLSDSQEVSPAQIAEISSFMNDQNISVVYYQDSASSQLAETLATEAGAELEVLYDIEGIPKTEREQGVNYLILMRENLEALQKVIK